MPNRNAEFVLLDPRVWCVDELSSVFNRCFRDSERTILLSGASEPLYQPAAEPGDYHRIYSTRDYFSSALHEISHWCIAGKVRRQQVDYGYWYEPDGRDASQQREFERVEIKPQALEWVFAEVCGCRFRLSVDNLDQPEVGVSEAFKMKVAHQAQRYWQGELPARAGIFVQALWQTYRSHDGPMSGFDPCFDVMSL